MQYDAVEPTPCPDCGHPVYRPFVLPVRRRQESCRAVVTAAPVVARCGCANAVHRLPTLRPRHRGEPR